MATSRSGIHPGVGGGEHRRKLVALTVLAIPVALVALFALAEGLGNEAGWWGHLIQLAIVLTVAVVSWLVPRVAGPGLVLLGIAFVVWVGVNAVQSGFVNLAGVVLVGVPLIVSGVLFARSGRE
jgi:hypothetical protein